MSYLFPPSRPLLNPQFETYKLHPLDPEADVKSYPLPGEGATQSRVGYNQHQLSFNQVRSRISWDHLSVGEGGRGIYVDVNWDVVGFSLNEKLEPVFTTLASLPTPVSTGSSSSIQPEYPSVLPLTPTRWAISSGSGSLYILETSPISDSTFSGNFIARYDLPSTTSEELSPFLLHDSHSVTSNDAQILLTRAVRSYGQGKYKPQQTTFDLIECQIKLQHRNDVDNGNEQLVINWRLRGKDLPFWCGWSGDGWIILSGDEFRESDDAEATIEDETSREKERDERIGKLGLGASLPEQEAEEAGTAPKTMVDAPGDTKAWPYSWTQTSTSISVALNFPPQTSRKEISELTLSPTEFTLKASEALRSHRELPPTLSKFLSKSSRSWWTNISPSESTWTFDSSKGLLEIDLVKVDENTRWPSLFTPSDSDSEIDEDDDEVPETISPATLAAIRDSFASIKTREPDEPAGNHPAIPALLREEMDFDIEDGEDFGDDPGGGVAGSEGMFGGGEPSGGSKVGREVLVGFIRNTEGTVKTSWSKQTSSILSTPIASLGSQEYSTPSVMVKSAVDGLLFTPESEDPAKQPWSHIATNPALAFVLSSKRDLRLIRHLVSSSSTLSPTDPTSPPSLKRVKVSSGNSSTVLAFEAGSTSGGSGNLYVYYPAVGETAKQGVVVVSGLERGALLGVGCVRVEERDVVVALCEKALVVLEGVL